MLCKLKWLRAASLVAALGVSHPVAGGAQTGGPAPWQTT
jgi:hypothetical protein